MDQTEYAFAPGSRTYALESGAICTVHAGNGVTKETMERAMRIYMKFKAENERKAMRDEAA